MKNVTSTWRAIAKLARARGESMVGIPVEGVERLTEHLQRMDRVFLAAESLIAVAEPEGYWSADEIEGHDYLKESLRQVES